MDSTSDLIKYDIYKSMCLIVRVRLMRTLKFPTVPSSFISDAVARGKRSYQYHRNVRSKRTAQVNVKDFKSCGNLKRFRVANKKFK